MADRTEREKRDFFAGTIMRAVAFHGAGSLLSVTADDGTKPIVVAFEHELVSDVLHRVSWTGGYANLFVIDRESEMMTRAAVMPPEASLNEGVAEVLGADAIHADAQIGMLLTNVQASRAGLTIQVRLPKSQADVKEIGEPETVPVKS